MPSRKEAPVAPPPAPGNRGQRPALAVKIPVFLMVLGLIATLMCSPQLAAAGGIVHVFPPSFRAETFAVARLQVLLSRTLVTVSDSVVRYRIDQTFFNDNEFLLEGLFILPFEKGHEPADLAVRVNGVAVHFEVVRPDQFFPTLRQLTTNMRDPSLLGLAGKTVLLVRPMSFGIKEQKSFRVEFTVPNRTEDNLLRVSVPLDGERFSLGPVGVCDINVRFNGSRSVRTVFSCTHHLCVVREAPHRCLAYAKHEKTPVRHDFSMLAAFSGKDLDFRLLPHKLSGEKGAFAAFIEPPLSPQQAEEPDKDVVFILDTSGSMSKDNLDVAKRTVVFGLEKLRPGDRFNVLLMKTHPERLGRQLLPATRENVLEAVGFVNSASAEGGTDLYNSFMNALEQFKSRKRPCMIVFAGHGRGTVGITEPETILDDVKRRNKVRARIFTLAVGERADMAVLNKLAATNGGSCLHFSQRDSFPVTVNRLFARVTPPLVSELSMDFQDITTEALFPDPLPDLFGSEGVVVLGRYDEKQDTVSKVRLKGRIKGRMKTVTRTITFPEEDPVRSFISALWAMRRIGRLLEKEWFKGPEAESRRQIQALANEYGFRTPFPSRPSSSVSQPAMGGRDAAGLFWLFKTSHVIADVESDQFRRIGERVFHRDKRAWVDNGYRTSLPKNTVEFLSEEYFSLLHDKPVLGSSFALGPDVIVVQDKAAIVVAPKNQPEAAR
jgi:Ca-activated chloride channel homolog